MTTGESVTVAERIALALGRHGVKMIFAQSLPSAVVLACEGQGIRQIAYRQENMGGAMADGYARISGQVPVVCAQNGPAATLLVAPLAEALKASIPIVALVQEVERPYMDRNAFQELDHLAIFSGCTKWTKRIITNDRVEDYVDQAFVAAASGRPGPAVLLLPGDLLREPAAEPLSRRSNTLGNWPLDAIQPGAAQIQQAARVIGQAKHPVILAGGGVHSGGAAQALADLQELAAIPVFTTNMGKGAVDEHHPLSCGVLGALNGPGSLGQYTRAILDHADVVLLAGTRSNQNGTDSWRLIPPSARVLHIDIDPNEIGRNYEAMRLVGDAASTLNALTTALQASDLSRRHAARNALESQIAAAWAAFARDLEPALTRNASSIRPERVMAELQKLLTETSIVVADASYSSMWVAGQLRSSAVGTRYITPRGLAGLGWGVPLAMGAKLARPDERVIAIVGDGGFAHSWAELETMVRMQIPICVIVLNNGVLGYQKDAEYVRFGTFTTACRFAPVDHAAIAQACGCRAVRVEDVNDLAQRLAEALDDHNPWLLDVVTDPDAHPPLSLFAGSLDQVHARE
ncbi:acetolactate synthase catalytic subunit [Rhizobium rhizogenes]|uniref:acetolactate synthase catalytic subunit n=1 Tax=Rhizobium rhizogenes TaxID=359 RepID=UPI00157249A5|nr:acetolactate synthase catalytic subunit [Rhizobium rhizogenes]NTI32923.1 acetolactate synthase catalytic subunit [Rhizobium rhizogenes]